jgi:NAD kinase
MSGIYVSSIFLCFPVMLYTEQFTINCCSILVVVGRSGRYKLLIDHKLFSLEKKVKKLFIFQTIPETNQLVLNEVVIDRGPSPYLSNIDLYLDGKLITSVQVSKWIFFSLSLGI